MINIFTIKRGDTSPGIKYSLLPDDIDLTGAAVRFQMKNQQGKTVTDAPANIDQFSEPPVVSYAWTAQDTAAPGDHLAEFKVTYPDGRIETFPNDDFIYVAIRDDVRDLPAEG